MVDVELLYDLLIIKKRLKRYKLNSLLVWFILNIVVFVIRQLSTIYFSKGTKKKVLNFLRKFSQDQCDFQLVLNISSTALV